MREALGKTPMSKAVGKTPMSEALGDFEGLLPDE